MAQQQFGSTQVSQPTSFQRAHTKFAGAGQSVFRGGANVKIDEVFLPWIVFGALIVIAGLGWTLLAFVMQMQSDVKKDCPDIGDDYKEAEAPVKWISVAIGLTATLALLVLGGLFFAYKTKHKS